TTSLAPLRRAWTASGIVAAVPGPSRSLSSATLVTLTRAPAEGGRSTIPTAPMIPEGVGSGGSTSKRASTLTPGTTRADTTSPPWADGTDAVLTSGATRGCYPPVTAALRPRYARATGGAG